MAIVNKNMSMMQGHNDNRWKHMSQTQAIIIMCWVKNQMAQKNKFSKTILNSKALIISSLLFTTFLTWYFTKYFNEETIKSVDCFKNHLSSSMIGCLQLPPWQICDNQVASVTVSWLIMIYHNIPSGIYQNCPGASTSMQLTPHDFFMRLKFTLFTHWKTY